MAQDGCLFLKERRIMKVIRRAKEDDKKEIVNCILDAFQRDFSGFINSVGREKVQQFLEESICSDFFYLMEDEQVIMGVLALSDDRGRALKEAKKAAQKHFGFLFGWILYLVNFKEFEKVYCDSPDAAFIEFVAVKQEFQGRGIATDLLKRVISESPYKCYILDVVDTNHAAISCYNKLNFSEIKREKVKFGKQKGFQEKIFMEYRKKTK